MIGLHLGPLHPAEQALTLLLAFGPFVLLGIGILLRRRQGTRSAGGAREEGAPASTGSEPPRSARC